MSANLDKLIAMGLPFARCDETFPPGTIGVFSADLARYPRFSMSMQGVKYPYGTKIDWRIGCDLIGNLNKVVRELTGDWLWVMGDDHVFDTNILMRLLSHMYDDGLDMVAPLVMGRQAPFPTVVGALDEPSKRIDSVLARDCSGLQLRDVVGSAGLLLRRKVLDGVGEPWFEAGSIVRTGLGEDWHFCLKAKQRGFQLHVDSDVEMGHMTSMIIWPHKPGTPDAGIRLDLGEGHNLVIQHNVGAAGAATPA